MGASKPWLAAWLIAFSGLVAAPAAGTPAVGGTTGELVCVGYNAPLLGSAGKLCFPRAAQILFVTEYGPAGTAPRRTEQQTAINVPTPIDVDGKAGADVIATFRIASASSFVLEITKAPGAAAALPVSVVAALKDPGGSTDRYVLGYDARATGAPASFAETIAPALGPNGTALDLDVATSGATGSLTLVGQAHTAGAGEAVVNPTQAGVTFTPVPANIGADLFFPAAGATDRTTAALTTSSPSKVDLSGSSVSGSDKTTFSGTVDKLAGTLSTVIASTPIAATDRLEDGDAQTVLTATATGPRITKATLTLTELVSGVQDTKTVATITDVPNTTTVTLTPATKTAPMNIAGTATPAAGAVDVERVEGTGDAARLAGERFARVVTRANPAKPAESTLKSAAAHLVGLSEVDVKIADGHVDVLARTAPGPLRVLVDGHGPRIEANATSLPACVRFAFTKTRLGRTCSKDVGGEESPAPDPRSKVILLEGSTAGSAAVDVEVDPVEGGKKLHAHVAGLPQRAEVVMNGADRLDVDTAGGRIGLAEVTLTSGPRTDVLPGHLDGVKIRKKLHQDANHDFHLDRDVLFARARDVNKVRFGLSDGDLDATVDTTRNGPFQVDVEQDEEPNPRSFSFGGVTFWFPAVVKYFHVNASTLTRNTHLTFDDKTGAVKIHYHADGEIPQLQLNTNLTGSIYTEAVVSNVARALDLCIHPGNQAIGGDQHPCRVNGDFNPQPAIPNGPTVAATAAAPLNDAAPMTLRLMDCKKYDSTNQCGVDRDEAEYLSLNGVQFRKLALQIHTQASGDADLLLDTDWNPVHGSLVMRTHASKKPDKAFATFYGVRAENRRVRIATALAGQGAPVQTDGSARGDIHCTTDANGKFDIYVVDNSFIGSLLLPLCFKPDGPDAPEPVTPPDPPLP